MPRPVPAVDGPRAAAVDRASAFVDGLRAAVATWDIAVEFFGSGFHNHTIYLYMCIVIYKTLQDIYTI